MFDLLFAVIKHATTAVLATAFVAGVSNNCTYAKGTKLGGSAKRLTQRKRNWKGRRRLHLQQLGHFSFDLRQPYLTPLRRSRRDIKSSLFTSSSRSVR